MIKTLNTVLFLLIILGAGLVTYSYTKPIQSQNVLSVSTEPEVLPEPTKSHTVVKEPPAVYTLRESVFIAQSFNNCGPASLSMAMSMFGKNISQEELAGKMRPFNNPVGGVDDKSIFAKEYVAYAKEYGFNSLHRPNGSMDLLKELVANDIPVVVRTWLNPYEDIGHFRLVRGYDAINQTVLVDDSYNGPNLVISQSEFLSMWQPFNYGYILVYPEEKQEVVAEIVGEEMNENIAWQHAKAKAQKELEENPSSVYSGFNLAVAHYYLGETAKAVEVYEQFEYGLPGRMLWYQIEPIEAYKAIHNFDRAFQLTDSILYSGNEAYSELYQMRGEMYLSLENKDAARAEFEKAIYYNKNFKQAQLSLQNM